MSLRSRSSWYSSLKKSKFPQKYLPDFYDRDAVSLKFITIKKFDIIYIKVEEKIKKMIVPPSKSKSKRSFICYAIYNLCKSKEYSYSQASRFTGFPAN